MGRLALYSLGTLAVLFGLLFAILTAVIFWLEAPLWLALIAAVVFSGIQYAIAPYIIQWIHKIDWMPVERIDPEIASLVRSVAHKHGIREPRFGVIADGNPNAFTFGHHPGNARVVVTTGLLEVCDTAQRRAVVAHELGHIIHWDFVVMTVAATVPLVLYYIYVFTMRGRSRRDGGIVFLVGVGALLAHIISRYIVLGLSRVREYYADEFSARATHDPNALAEGLVKIAYGLARSRPPAEKEEQPVAASAGMKPFGIFDATFGKSMAVATAGAYGLTDGEVSNATAVEAMKWDLWNPWGALLELRSTHPLPAKRIRALGRIAELMGQPKAFEVPGRAPQSYWDEFATDLLVSMLPVAGLVVGAVVGLVVGWLQGMPGTGIAILVAGLGLGMIAKLAFTHPRNRFRDGRVAALVGEVRVSAIRPIPVRLRGEVIGRGIPGLYWGEDLVLQDESGFILLDYRQPVRIFEFLFGLFRADSFIGQRVIAEGWYRRAPAPFVELWKVRLPGGDVHTSHNWGLSFALALLLAGGGIITALLTMLAGL
ncbi:MAG: M48 family metalloprotease [Armatimonadota bacterium]|nr:M48 family metalloprotease [Armatimonadota bacterium]